MSDHNNSNNNTTDNNSNDTYEGMELFEEDIKKAEFAKESNKRAIDDDDDNEEPEFKRQKKDDSDESDDVSSENSENSSVTSDSISDDGEVSETDRINTKYSKRFDAIEDYEEKNELLCEMSIQNVMNKLDNGETISEQEFETLNRANRLMDQDILKDKDSIQRMQLYEDFSSSVQKEISENNARIEWHKEKLSEYEARLEELNKEDSEISSNNDSSDFNNESNSDNNNSNPNSDNSSNSPGPNNGNDDGDDGFDDFPPSFDFDDF